MNILANKYRTQWLQWQNKILSGIISAMGYAPHADKDEIDIIVPMYGMPSSVYKKMEEAAAEEPLPSETPCLHILAEKQPQYGI